MVWGSTSSSFSLLGNLRGQQSHTAWLGSPSPTVELYEPLKQGFLNGWGLEVSSHEETAVCRSVCIFHRGIFSKRVCDPPKGKRVS